MGATLFSATSAQEQPYDTLESQLLETTNLIRLIDGSEMPDLVPEAEVIRLVLMNCPMYGQRF